jgi:hypothetical protein
MSICAGTFGHSVISSSPNTGSTRVRAELRAPVWMASINELDGIGPTRVFGNADIGKIHLVVLIIEDDVFKNRAEVQGMEDGNAGGGSLILFHRFSPVRLLSIPIFS